MHPQALIAPLQLILTVLQSPPHQTLLHPWTLTPTDVTSRLGHATTVANKVTFPRHAQCYKISPISLPKFTPSSYPCYQNIHSTWNSPPPSLKHHSEHFKMYIKIFQKNNGAYIHLLDMK